MVRGHRFSSPLGIEVCQQTHFRCIYCIQGESKDLDMEFRILGEGDDVSDGIIWLHRRRQTGLA